MMQIEPTGQACGAVVTGVDLAGPLAAETVAAIRAAWLQHHVLAFPDQRLSADDLDLFTLAMGGLGEDPFIPPIARRPPHKPVVPTSAPTLTQRVDAGAQVLGV